MISIYRISSQAEFRPGLPRGGARQNRAVASFVGDARQR